MLFASLKTRTNEAGFSLIVEVVSE